MAINDVAGEMVYHVRDILRQFLHNGFVSRLCTLKPKNLKTVSKKPRFFRSCITDVFCYNVLHNISSTFIHFTVTILFLDPTCIHVSRNSNI